MEQHCLSAYCGENIFHLVTRGRHRNGTLVAKKTRNFTLVDCKNSKNIHKTDT